MNEAIIVFASIVYGAGALMFALEALVEHGISENNIVRSVVRAMRGFIWPLWVVARITTWSRTYFKTRFRKEWQEAFPGKITKARSKIPARVTVADLVAAEPTYKPGQWIN